jgi:hypothetical protein
MPNSHHPMNSDATPMGSNAGGKTKTQRLKNQILKAVNDLSP